MKKIYLWKGISKEGLYEKGKIGSPNIRLAQAYLKEKGIHKLIYLKQQHFLTCFRFGYQKKVTFLELTSFFNHLNTLLSAGISLVQALKTIQHYFSSPLLKKLILEIERTVTTGYPLSHALKQYPKLVPSLVCQWIESGEQSGKIERVLAQLVADRERQWLYRQKIKSLLIYPLFVVTVAIALVLTLLIWVIPQWATLFASSQMHLPVLTQLILSASTILRKYGLGLFFIWILSVVYLRSLLKKKRLLQKWYRLKWRIPYIRSFCQDHFLMTWAQMLSLSLSAGVPLIHSLKSLKNVEPFSSMQSSMLTLLLSLETGHSLTASLQTISAFSPFMIQMVAIGEESGHLEEMIQKAGKFYEAELERKLRNLLQLLEPFIITVLGLIVGLIVMGMYLPIFQLGNIV